VRVEARQDDLVGVETVAGPADGEVLVGELLGGERGYRLRDGIADERR
jgi:hypothetical protein